MDDRTCVAAYHARVSGRLPLFIRHTFSDIIVAVARAKLYQKPNFDEYTLAIRAEQLEKTRATCGARVRMDLESHKTLACTGYVNYLGLHIYTDAHIPDSFEHPFALFGPETPHGIV